MTTRVRWGILGTAAIAREAMIPAMRTAPYCDRLELLAMASRRLPRAQAVAQRWSIERAYGSYEALLADPEIDAVYIPLPNHLHVPYSILALEAGKHVLCEKPLALSLVDAQRLEAVARRHPRLKLMEAFMYRFHPQWRWAQRIIAEGQIGALQKIETRFSFFDDNPASILHRPEWGGGALMDIGCYGVSLSRWLFAAEPMQVKGSMQIDRHFGVDRTFTGLLEFTAGTAKFVCSTREPSFQRVEATGALGRLTLEVPFNPPNDQTCRALLEAGGAAQTVAFAPGDQYGLQADAFSRAIQEQADVPTPLADALANMQVIDALVRSANKKSWQRVS